MSISFSTNILLVTIVLVMVKPGADNEPDIKPSNQGKCELAPRDVPPGTAHHCLRTQLVERYPTILYVLPLAVFMALTSLEPKPVDPAQAQPGWQLPYELYPIVYACKVALTLAAVVAVMPGYRAMPGRLTPWSAVVGILGGLVWIALCRLHVERHLVEMLTTPNEPHWLKGYVSARSAYNPLEHLAATPALAWGFLAVRFFGLVALVPLIEEFFLRGFLMRYVMRADWWNVPFGDLNGVALAVGTLIPMLMHPGEIVAAAVWFSLVTWLMIKTRSIWDCVAAHALTNLVLGIYVVSSGDWSLM